MTSKTLADAAVEFDPQTNIEVWEITTDSTQWVLVRDPRDPTGYKKQQVGGRQGGSRRLRITTDDRRFNQEQIVPGNEGLDPFRNGMFRKIDETHVDDIDTTYHLTVDQLLEIFNLRDMSEYEPKIESIASELVLRRLMMLAEQHATVAQLELLRNTLEQRYPIGGSQKTWREMNAAGEFAGGELLS